MDELISVRGEKVGSGLQLGTALVTHQDGIQAAGAEKGGDRDSCSQLAPRLCWTFGKHATLPAHQGATQINDELNFHKMVLECASLHAAPEVPFLTTGSQTFLQTSFCKSLPLALGQRFHTEL